MKYLLSKEYICLLCWNAILIILVWQVLLSTFSMISNIALLLLFIVDFTKLCNNRKKIVFIILWGMLLLASYSIIQQNDIILIFRFSLVLFFVLGAYFVRLDYKVCLKSLFFISLTLCVSLIIFEIYLFLVYGGETAPDIRFYLTDNGFGDSYFKNFFYVIQIKGVAIIPFVYMLSYAVDLFPKNRRILFRVLYLLAIGIAGNFAFILAIVGFHSFFHFTSTSNRRVLFRRLGIGFIAVLTVGGFFLSYVNDVLESKKDYSNAIRVEQAMLLLSDMQENPLTVLFGKGVGNTIDVVTPFRSYVGSIYFELQTLYIFNQLGVVLFILFVIVNILFVCMYIPSNMLKTVYGGYVIYAITNPYILDTNHVVVIISIISSQTLLASKKTTVWGR